jgi:hypothetical protein
LWSSAFPGKPTGAGAAGTIDGISVIMDVDSVSMGALEIINGGTLKWKSGYSAVLTATNVHVEVGSNLEIGSAATPYGYPNRGQIVLTGAPAVPNDGHQRSIMFHNSRFFADTNPPVEPWQEITDHIPVNGTSAIMSGNISDWHVGDEIRISPTDWYDIGGWDYRIITSIVGQVISWSGGVAFRWGKLQYPTDAGLSLTPGTFSSPAGTPTVLNERAVINNLTRTFTISSVVDSNWTTNGFGCHVMVMDLNCTVDVKGVEFRRGGQAGTLGRYGGIHWHQVSITPDSDPTPGVILGDIPAGKGKARYNVIRDSAQRGDVIHGTCGVTLDHNSYDNIHGHQVFLEAAVEERNFITNNCFGAAFDPLAGKVLLQHELFNGESGSACIWNANPNNTITGNYGSYAATGLWNSFPGTPVANYTLTAKYPRNTRMGLIDNNRFQSMRGTCSLGRGTQIDTLGNVDFQGMYAPHTDDTPAGADVSFEISRMTLTKGQNGAYRHTTGYPYYNGWATANNVWLHFVGKTGVPSDVTPTPNKLGFVLAVGFSLNNANEQWPSGDYVKFPSGAFVSYHSTIPQIQCTIMHFRPALTYEPAVMDGFSYSGGGAWGTEDLYVNGFQRGTYFDQNNRFIDTPRAMRTRGLNMIYPGVGRQGLSPAVWDPFGQRTGMVGTWVFNIPYMTYQATVVGNAPTYLTQSPGDNGVVISDECYGLDGIQTDWDPASFTFLGASTFSRIDPTTKALVGTYSFPQGVSGTTDYFRFTSFVNNGVFMVDHPGQPLSQSWNTEITNCRRSTDSFIVGINFDLSAGISANYRIPGATSGPNFRGLSAAGSYAALAAGDGTLYYADTTGAVFGDSKPRIWIKFVGTLNRGTLTTGTWAWLEQPLWISINKV